MDKTKSESVTKEVTTEEEKVDDLLNTFNSQLKIEQKTADQKVNNRFKPYKSKKRKRKSLSLKVQTIYLLYIYSKCIHFQFEVSFLISILGDSSSRKDALDCFQKLLRRISFNGVLNGRSASFLWRGNKREWTLRVSGKRRTHTKEDVQYGSVHLWIDAH